MYLYISEILFRVKAVFLPHVLKTFSNRNMTGQIVFLFQFTCAFLIFLISCTCSTFKGVIIFKNLKKENVSSNFVFNNKLTVK